MVDDNCTTTDAVQSTEGVHSTSVWSAGIAPGHPVANTTVTDCTPSASCRLENWPAISASVRATVPCPRFDLVRKSALSMAAPVGRASLFVHIVPEGTRVGWDHAASIANRERQM